MKKLSNRNNGISLGKRGMRHYVRMLESVESKYKKDLHIHTNALVQFTLVNGLEVCGMVLG